MPPDRLLGRRCRASLTSNAVQDGLRVPKPIEIIRRLDHDRGLRVVGSSYKFGPSYKYRQFFASLRTEQSKPPSRRKPGPAAWTCCLDLSFSRSRCGPGYMQADSWVCAEAGTPVWLPAAYPSCRAML